MSIGETMKIFRIANNYTAKKLSQESGVSVSVITALERNTTQRPSISTLRALSQAFELPLSTIFDIQELSERESWDFQKTLLEVLKIYVGE